MTLYGLRLLVALLTFAVGAAAAWLFDSKSPQPAGPRVVTQEVLFTYTAYVEVSARACNYNRRYAADDVLNGESLSKPVPVYPRAAKVNRVEGTVDVDIVVDEDGRVESAVAVSGPELLRDAAVEAARATTFEPTRLTGHPSRGRGTLTYKFMLD
jgi:TonB family protein